MKKLTKIVSCLTIAYAFVSCNHDAGNNIPIIPNIPIIDVTPGEPINRDNTLSISNVVELEIDRNYDFSDYQGKKAFLIVENENKYNEVAFPNQTNASEYNFESLIKQEGQFYSVPYNPPTVDFILDDSSEINFDRSISRTQNQTAPAIGDTRDFYAATSDDLTNDEWAKNCILKVIGNHCYIWYKAKNGISITDAKLQSLANTFDSIYEKETYIFGNNYLSEQPHSSIIDVTDNNTKVNIIVYDIYNDVETTKQTHGGVYGYFWNLDFSKSNITYPTSENQTVTLKTNKCQCLHIDSYFLEVAEKAQQSTIAHEFQHLLQYVNKSLKDGPKINGSTVSFRTLETWFKEMMSMVCEDIMQSQLNLEDSASPKSRLSLFNSAYRLGFKNWRSGNAVYVSYANAYAFGAYLLRNYGIDFIHILATNNYIEEDAITAALASINASETTMEQVMDKYYNVVLNPKATQYTLNKSVSQTYTIAGIPVTFNCSAINLFDYLTFSRNELTEEMASILYQGSKYNDYYGPVIVNNIVYNNLDGYGMFVSFIGTVGSDFNKNFKLGSSQVGTENSHIKYRLAFVE